jgi:hypothetical protein
MFLSRRFSAPYRCCDIFDFAFKANARNVALVEQYYDPRRRPRSMRALSLAVLGFAVLVLGISAVLVYFVAKALIGFAHALT